MAKIASIGVNLTSKTIIWYDTIAWTEEIKVMS